MEPTTRKYRALRKIKKIKKIKKAKKWKSTGLVDSPHAPSDLGFYLPWMGVNLRLKRGGAGLAGFVDDFSFLELAG